MLNPSQNQYPPSYSILDCVPLPVRIIERAECGKPVYHWFNRVAAANTGRTLDNVCGKSAEEVFPCEWGEIATQHHRDVFESKQPFTYMHKMPLAAGLRTLQTTLVPVNVNDDEKLRIIASTLDVTTDLNHESEWLKAQTISQNITEFAESTAQALRAPLRQIEEFAEVMKEGFEDLGDGKLHMIDAIKDIAARATDLSNDLLETSSSIAASVRCVETFELMSLCKDLFSSVDPLMHHNLTHDPAQITADRTAIQIILRNLVNNALMHYYPNIVNVNVSVKTNEIEKNQLIFTVSASSDDVINPHGSLLEASADPSESGQGLSAIQRLLQNSGDVFSVEQNRHNNAVTVKLVFPGSLA